LSATEQNERPASFFSLVNKNWSHTSSAFLLVQENKVNSRQNGGVISKSSTTENNLDWVQITLIGPLGTGNLSSLWLCYPCTLRIIPKRTKCEISYKATLSYHNSNSGKT